MLSTSLSAPSFSFLFSLLLVLFFFCLWRPLSLSYFRYEWISPHTSSLLFFSSCLVNFFNSLFFENTLLYWTYTRTHLAFVFGVQFFLPSFFFASMFCLPSHVYRIYWMIFVLRISLYVSFCLMRYLFSYGYSTRWSLIVWNRSNDVFFITAPVHFLAIPNVLLFENDVCSFAVLYILLSSCCVCGNLYSNVICHLHCYLLAYDSSMDLFIKLNYTFVHLWWILAYVPTRNLCFLLLYLMTA